MLDKPEGEGTESSPAHATTHYSGVVIQTTPARVDDCARALDALSGVEVHYRHPGSGRIIAVLESETREGQEERLVRVQSVPGVILAELVYHYVDSPRPDRAHDDAQAPGEWRGEP
jgi:nitrate reductase NapAB chaperone NapD